MVAEPRLRVVRGAGVSRFGELLAGVSGRGGEVAEGFGRYHFLDKAKFYLNARGSLYELKRHLLIATELQFIKAGDIADVLQIIEQLSLQINNLINATRRLRKNETRD
jgi:23S rRNA-intervening sequence protein